MKRRDWSANDWLVDNGGATLLVVGLALVALSFVADSAAVFVPLVIMGAGAAILGVLLPRVEGPVEVSPSGIEAVLKAVGLRAIQRKVEELGIPPEEKDKVVAEALADFEQRNVAFLAPAAKAVADMPAPKIAAEAPAPVEQLQSLGYEAIVETAEKLAEDAIARTSTVRCADCGADLDERSDLPQEERQSCPTCGSTARTIAASGGGSSAGNASSRSVHDDEAPTDAPEADTRG